MLATHSPDVDKLSSVGSPTALPDSTYFFEPEVTEEEDATILQVEPSQPVLNTESTMDVVIKPKSTSDTSMPKADVVRPPVRHLQTSKSLATSQEKKMHQTSTRIMRTNPDGRPFASDFHDLFSTLIVSLSLRTHRSRFKSYNYSFTTEEAVLNLANLKFAQSNRMPDPNDPTRIVTTTTTTTFSMAKDMAKALCQRFMDARFFEAAADKSLETFKDKTIWTLTPKGICKLGRFVMRNGIAADHITKLLSSGMNTMQLIILERDSDTDEIVQDKSFIEIVFRRFAGRIPNAKSTTAASDTDSISEYTDGMIGVKVADVRRFGDQVIRHSFTGRTAICWLTECTTVLDLDEAHDLAVMFLSQNLINYVGDARGRPAKGDSSFQSAKSSIYVVTPKGRRVAGWDPGNSADSQAKHPSTLVSAMKRLGSDSGTGSTRSISDATTIAKVVTIKSPDTSNGSGIKETNTDRLQLILADAALRSQFRVFLRENYCEENLSFYQDVIDFVRQINNVQEIDGVSEGLAKAYSIYNAYLAAGSPCELNLDHQLRLEMAAQMTKAVNGDETSMYNSLAKVAELYDRAQKQVFRLMAGDSVPKFLKTPLYLELIEDYDSDKDQ